MYSFMDEFSGYNQISIVEEDKLKTIFVVEDGVCAYNRMSFGLCNAPAMFQRIILHILESKEMQIYGSTRQTSWPYNMQGRAEDKS